jgi:hypothetical protein
MFDFDRFNESMRRDKTIFSVLYKFLSILNFAFSMNFVT